MYINLRKSALLLISEATTSGSKTTIEQSVCCGDTSNQELTYRLQKRRRSVVSPGGKKCNEPETLKETTQENKGNKK